jgi:predicted outer membrane repeat protein
MRTASRAMIVAVAFGFASVPATAMAGSFAVNSTTDAVDAGGCVTPGVPCTLRDAVMAADAAGGSSTITVPGGTYMLTIAPSGPDDVTTGDLNVTAPITINGAGAASTIIDGGGHLGIMTDRVFRVESTGGLTLSGATVQHGHPAGGQTGTLSEGGGILAYGPLTLTDASVSGNWVETPGDPRHGAGAGISQEASAPISLTRVTVSNNMVKVASGLVGGGGGLMVAGGPAGRVTIADSTISENTAAGPGGGIYTNGTIVTGGAITITGTTISGQPRLAATQPGQCQPRVRRRCRDR